MRKLYYLILLLLVQNVSIAQWETVYWTSGTPRLPDLFAVKFTDINNGMAVGGWFDTLNFTGYYPIILRTSDSGTSWDTVYSNTTPGFVGDIEFIDNSTAVAIGGDYNNAGIIYRTNDFGNTWSITVTSPLSSLHFPSYFIAFLVGDNGTVMKSTDAGISWNNAASLPSINLYAVYFINDTVGFTVSDTTIFKTVDGGNNWSDFNLPNSGSLYGIHFPSDSVGYVFMYNSSLLTTIFKTTDCGQSWNSITNLSLNVPVSMWFTDNNTGYITSIFSIKKTTDGGITWTDQASSPPSWGSFMDWVSDVYFLDDTVGFAVGNSQFYRTYNGGELLPVSVYNSTSNTAEFNVYPNPSSGKFTVRLDKFAPNQINIVAIYNNLGQLILEEKIEFPGILKIDISGSPAGIYYIRAFDGEKYLSAKVVVRE
ncbi:MAG: VPS10 domain-containing protein [Bacteroidia bacterium]